MHILYILLLTSFPVDIFLPFDIISHSALIIFYIISSWRFLLFAILSHSALLPLFLCPFVIIYHSTFCPFNVFDFSMFFQSTFCPIWRFVCWHFLPSAFFTLRFCRWISYVTTERLPRAAIKSCIFENIRWKEVWKIDFDFFLTVQFHVFFQGFVTFWTISQ
jgi:hypothetical protein